MDCNLLHRQIKEQIVEGFTSGMRDMRKEVKGLKARFQQTNSGVAKSDEIRSLKFQGMNIH